MDARIHHHMVLVSRYLCFVLGIIVVSGSLKGAETEQVSTECYSGLFDYVSVHPFIQKLGEPVDFLCVLQLENFSDEVTLTIKNPLGALFSTSMIMSSKGKYEWSDVFLILGRYSYNVTVKKGDRVFAKSNNSTFWIARSRNDRDSDGMPDSWENMFGFDPANPHDSSWDDDRDGLSNLEEFKIGSNPLVHEHIFNSFYRLQNKKINVMVSVIFFLCIGCFSWYAMRRSGSWY
jgi:hypothetical protein